MQSQSLDDLGARGHQHRDRDPVTSDPQREPSPPPPYSAASAAQLPCYDTVTRTCADGTAVTALAQNDSVFMKRCDSMIGSSEYRLSNFALIRVRIHVLYIVY